MERNLQDQVNNYDKDKALWEDRNVFLIQQRDQAKKDLEEASQKFQLTVEQLQKVQSEGKNKTETQHSSMMHQLEQKFNQRIKEISDSYGNANQELQQKVKQVERDKA